MNAALFRRQELMWRSTQFTETLSFPPMNHLACGGFHSRTLFHFLNHSSCEACSAQKLSGSRSARWRKPSSETRAAALKSAEGANFRFSLRSASISVVMDLL